MKQKTNGKSNLYLSFFIIVFSYGGSVERYISKFLVTGDVKSENRPFIRGNEERLLIEKSVSFFCLRRQGPSDKRSLLILTQGERNL